MKLDRNRAYGQTFGADAGAMPLFQDNVYFDIRGDVVDCPYNRDNSPQLFAVGEAAPVVDTPPPAPPKEPTVAEMLASKSDAEIYTAAVKLRAMLDEAGDADAYVPDPADKDTNVDFLLRHAGG